MIHHYEAEFMDGSGIIGSAKRFTARTLKVLGQNEEFMVVDNERFTTIQLIGTKDSDIYPVLNRPGISLHSNDNCWGNRVHYSLYSDKPVTPTSIRSAINKAINKRFGYFIGGHLDLSFIQVPK